MRSSPSALLSLSTTFYVVLLRSLIRADPSAQQVQRPIRAVSAFHSSLTTLSALYILRYSRWHVTSEIADRAIQSDISPKARNDGKVDDSKNPLIQGRSGAANALTAWEAGYLVYDTAALIYQSHVKCRGTFATAISGLVEESPVFLAHHVSLISALAYLQVYIAAGKEKGVWIIVAFLLMNASSPLLHARWWVKKKTGKASTEFDVAFAALFAVSRFGLVAWVLKRYGAYHGLSPWNAYRRLRWQCQVGTAALVGFNAVWWLVLVNNIMRRALVKKKK